MSNTERRGSKIAVVAWREFKYTVLRKVFLLALVGVPLLMIAVMALAGVLIATETQPPLVGTIGLVDPSGEVLDAARAQFTDEKIREDRAEQVAAATEAMSATGAPGGFDMSGQALPVQRGEVRIDLEHITGDAAGADALRERVRTGDLLAAAIVTADLLERAEGSTERGEFELFVSPDLDADHTRLIERRIGRSIARVRTTRAGLDADEAAALLEPPRSTTRRLLADGAEQSEGEGTRIFRQMVPMVFMMLMWVATFTAGQHLLMSTIEEKSNRVMEVLLSAVSPLQLMTGKILGQGGVGLVIVLLYSSLGVAALIVFAAMHLIDVMSLVYLVVYFFMGYFMVASIMAAVGSAVSDIREANALMMPVMLILMVPLMLWLPITQSPNGIVATVCSFVPPAIPFAMILRVAADEPVPLWQIPVTIVWGYACVLGMIWLAAKVFRVGVLMYGKPPSVLELLKWVRYA